MSTVVIGVRHKSAPIEVREKLAFSKEELTDALCEMLTLNGIEEAAILSTCNRTEVYATVTDTEVGIRSLKNFLKDYKQFDYNVYINNAFILLHEDAVMHLLRVASGLDSLVLGEGQIMAQVKEALKASMMAGAAGEMIDKLFKTALSVGKAVRSETGITNRDISVARAAFEFAQKHHPNFQQARIALIGAGKMAEILMTSIRSAIPQDIRQADQVVVVNRSTERAQTFTQKYGFPAYGWEQLDDVVKTYDLLFVATSSPHYVLQPSLFQASETSKLIIDISVPRNVDPSVGKNTGIQLYNTDDLCGYSGYSGENRVRLIQHAHQIIEREYQKYYQWVVGRPAAPMITQLRAHIDDICRNVIAEVHEHYPEAASNRDIIDNLSRTLVNKILHDPTVRLRSTPALEEIYIQAELISGLFNLPSLTSPHNKRSVLLSSPEESASNVVPLAARSRK